VPSAAWLMKSLRLRGNLSSQWHDQFRNSVNIAECEDWRGRSLGMNRMDSVQLEPTGQRHQGDAGQQRRRELPAVVGVELEFGQEVAQGDTEEGAGREGQRVRRDRGRISQELDAHPEE